jgi:hypothetical protein
VFVSPVENLAKRSFVVGISVSGPTQDPPTRIGDKRSGDGYKLNCGYARQDVPVGINN